MPKILRPTWGNKAENIKAEKGGAEKKIEKNIEKINFFFFFF